MNYTLRRAVVLERIVSYNARVARYRQAIAEFNSLVRQSGAERR